MTNDAPERIWLQDDGDYSKARSAGDDLTWCEDQINDADTEYVRVDLHAEAIEAAEQRGYARGIEVAVKNGQELAAAIQGDADAVMQKRPKIGEDRAEYADDLRDLIKELRALSPTPPAPLTAQEAARVLYSAWLVGAMEDGADAVADDAITDQWSHVDRTYPDAGPVIEAWLRAIAEQDGPSAPPRDGVE